MLLSPEDAELFFRLHRSLMCFMNQRLGILPGIDNPNQFSALPPETRFEFRESILDRSDLLEAFVAKNPYDFNQAELDIVSSWRHQIAGEFYVLKYLTNYAVFLASDNKPTAYGVLALTDAFDELIGPNLPVWTQTVLLPFKDKIVHDGLLASYNISFGPGIRRSLNGSYKAAKKRQGIITSLPAASPPRSTKPKKSRTKSKPASIEAGRDARDVILGMVEQFCRDHLNEEYAQVCRRLTESLARKRPSPLLTGRPNTWACGIVRTVGWVNFLSDPSQRPHIKLTDIDKAFGVGESTGQGQSMRIRRMLKISRFDHRWMLPSRIEDDPLIWILDVNGFPRDIRQCPREAQEIAFEKGLIPYIPADRIPEA